MRREALILREPEIRALLDPRSCIAAMEQAFAAYSTGRAQLPAVIHLDIPEDEAQGNAASQNRGEIHVKAGYLNGGPYYAVKIVSGFPNNPQLGLPANDGMIVVFDARTGAPAAFLLDNGFITDFRTGAAGAVAAKYLARAENCRGRSDRHRRAGAISGGDAGPGEKLSAKFAYGDAIPIRRKPAPTIWQRVRGIPACNFA